MGQEVLSVLESTTQSDVLVHTQVFFGGGGVRDCTRGTTTEGRGTPDWTRVTPPGQWESG